MEKWYVVEDGECYNVFSEEDINNYGIERDQIVKVTNNMDKAFDIAEKLNRDMEESSPNFSPMKGYYNESVNEAHGVKKHNSPKNTLSAIRKGNRDAEKEIYGDGFKSKKKLHKTGKTFDRKNNKVDINNLDKYQNESKKKSFALTENDIKHMVYESVKNLMKEDVDGNELIGKLFGGEKLGDMLHNENGEVNWGNEIEQLIAKLKEKFAEVIIPEEDEYGISSTPFETLINHLKYYYEHNTFDDVCFRKIYDMLDNYDLTSDSEVMNILRQLKNYC